MHKNKVLIIGSSGHSRVVIDVFEKENKFEIVGLLDLNRNIGEKVLGYKILGKEKGLPFLLSRNNNCELFIAIGDNWIRNSVKNKILSFVPNVKFATTIHPSAQIGKDVIIGKGVAIMPGAIVNSETTINDFCIINTNASIDHNSDMGEFSSLAPNVTTGGNVSIGSFTAVSISATIKNGINIGKHTVIGASSYVNKDCGDKEVVYGIPAKKIRNREIGDKYL